MQIETLAVHAGRTIDATTGAVTPPIHLSSTFERAPDGSFPHGYLYTRYANPNRVALEQCLMALEGGAAAAAFSSGSAATMSVLQALQPGDHVVAPRDAYTGTIKLLRELFVHWGLAVTFVDMSDVSAIAAALRPATRLIWIETPSNPLLTITDIASVVELAHAHGALVACDNTWATPLGQRPLELGADLVMHSTTKYLGGHSDVLGGAVIAREQNEFWERIAAIQAMGGAVPSPFECWLVLRGIQTLPYRVRAQSASAARIAQYLQQHERIECVYYPELPAHPGHAVALRQMRFGGGMLSFQVRGDQQQALAVAARVQLWTRATSLGGPESLIEHRASVEAADTRTPANLLRLSVGLEAVDDLIADLEQALQGDRSMG